MIAPMVGSFGTECDSNGHLRHHRGAPATDQATVGQKHLTAAARRLNRRIHPCGARSNHQNIGFGTQRFLVHEYLVTDHGRCVSSIIHVVYAEGHRVQQRTLRHIEGISALLAKSSLRVSREVQMVAPLLFDTTRQNRRRWTMARDTFKSPPGFLAALSIVLLSHFVTPVGAQDTIKVAVGQIDAWANQVPTLGMKAGIFQRHGIVLENFGTQGAGETLQAVISGSADIGIGVGTAGAMRAFVKGAPVRVLAAAYTGVEDIYWFVPANSPIKSVKDITDKHTIAYSTNGSTSDSVLRALI